MRRPGKWALASIVAAAMVAGGGSGAAATDAPGPEVRVAHTSSAEADPMESGAMEADPMDLDAYLATLTPDEREQFLATSVPAVTELEVGPQLPADVAALTSLVVAKGARATVSPMATGCWTQRWTWSPKAAAGNVLYTYYHVGYWCASGSKVTAARVADAGGETRTPGWRYGGVTKRAAGVVSNQGRSYTQHRFSLRVGGIEVQSPLQCGRVKGSSSGGASGDSVCGIY